MIYLDSSYIAKCYLHEPGTDQVLDLVENTAARASALIALTEVQATFHRQFREGKLTRNAYLAVSRRFEEDQAEELWCWLPITEFLVRQSTSYLQTLPPTIFLRSADCLHLSADAGFREIYSNDRHLLAAAPHFGLRGVDVIA